MRALKSSCPPNKPTPQLGTGFLSSEVCGHPEIALVEELVQFSNGGGRAVSLKAAGMGVLSVCLIIRTLAFSGYLEWSSLSFCVHMYHFRSWGNASSDWVDLG